MYCGTYLCSKRPEKLCRSLLSSPPCRFSSPLGLLSSPQGQDLEAPISRPLTFVREFKRSVLRILVQRLGRNT